MLHKPLQRVLPYITAVGTLNQTKVLNKATNQTSNRRELWQREYAETV